MGAEVEAAKYRLPEADYFQDEGGSHVIAGCRNLQYDFSLLDSLGFQQSEFFLAKKGKWRLWERGNHCVPSFPEGETIVNSLLAGYEPSDNSSLRLILRSSYEPINGEEVKHDLTVFARFFVERPYWIPAISFTRGEIAHPDQYTSGFKVWEFLAEEHKHTRAVFFQKEVYERLKGQGIDITPDDFLEKVYGDLKDSGLVDFYSNLTSRRQKIALEIIVKVAESLLRLQAT